VATGAPTDSNAARALMRSGPNSSMLASAETCDGDNAVLPCGEGLGPSAP